VFENRLLTKIFVPKREEVSGGWRGLHNEKLHNLYAYYGYHIIDDDDMGEACSTRVRDDNCIQNFGWI